MSRCVIEVEDARDLGVVEVRDGRVAHIYEKMEESSSCMVNAGLYLFTPHIFDAIAKTSKSPRGEFEITDSLQLMIEQGYNIAYQEISYWLNLSYPWDLLSANESLLAGTQGQNLGEVEDNVVIKGPVSIGEGCNFGSGTKIANLRLDKKEITVAGIATKRRKLGAIIGDGVETGINAGINVGSVIGNNTVIGPGAIASGVILPNSRIF